MFRLARLKLTGWYLLIIMLISTAFSLVVYKGITAELEKGFRRAELRLRAEELGIRLPHPMPLHPEELRPELRGMTPRFFPLEDLEAAKRRVILYLLSVNGVILVISATAGYFLAGKTLRPIEEALEDQKRFVADASHELRTPLTALKTSIEVNLRDEGLPEQARQILEDNLKDVDSLESLTDSLLHLAQHQKGEHDVEIEPVEINAVIRDAFKQVQPLAEEKGVEVKLDIEPTGQVVNADKACLKKLIVIFLDNAIKYTPNEGWISVAAKSSKKYLTLTVEDTGIGIDEKHLPHVFDRFYRVESSRSKSEAAGFGLGLSLAKRIVEAHQGSIDVASVVGKGTRFTIKLPLKH